MKIPGILLAFFLPLATSSAGEPPPPLRIREVYVPYEEFRALTAASPGGIVMDLEEYRELVRKACEAPRKEPPPPLPPIESAVIQAVYRGKLEERTARFTAALKVRSTSEGWIRLDLGAPIPGLARVLVDGQPGWIVISDPIVPVPAPAPVPVAGAQPATPPPPAPPARRAWLLLRGKGEHAVDLVFSAPAVESEDRWSLEGSLVPAAASRVELEVSGSVEARSEPPFLEKVDLEKGSRLVLAAGGAERFRMEWGRKKASAVEERMDLLLLAEHRVSFVLRRESPVFVWDAAVQVARRKAEVLVFREPPGASVLKVEGPLVHSWERAGGGVRVLLNGPVLGEVGLRFSGVLEAPGGRFVLGPPVLEGSFSDTGFLALYETAGGKAAVESTDRVSEASSEEARLPAGPGAEEGAPLRPALARVYAFSSSEARVTAGLVDLPARFEEEAAYLVRAGEGNLTLEGVLRVVPREGRLYRLRLLVPPPLRLATLAEAEGKGKPPHGLRHEETGPPDAAVVIILERAVEEGEPLVLRLGLEEPPAAEARDWDRRPVSITLPALSGAERSRTDLGIAIPSSMYLFMGDLAGYRSLAPAEIERLGLKAPAPESGSLPEALVAGLTTRRSGAPLGFTLVHRPPRGEYRAVTHLLALERALRVRADLRVAVVDRPVDALVFRLPPDAGPSALVLGEGIKETEAGAGGGRTVRFSKPWLGTRQFRVEYETALAPEAPVPLPSIEVESTVARGSFGSERFIVLQSQGPVEIRISRGPGLDGVDVDDVPDFASPWAGGRVLTAYRFRASPDPATPLDPGTIASVVHERAPVLARLARKVTLTTLLSREGISRTRAEVLFGATLRSRFTIAIPAGARVLSVLVNGDPIRGVIPGEAGGAPGGMQILSIPLPPQSYADLSITYERGSSAGSTARPLGERGSWREEAPVLPEVPVGETRWSVYHPEGYRFFVTSDELRSGDLRGFAGFAESFFGRILSGRLPVFTAFGEDSIPGPAAAIPELSSEEARGAELPRGSVAGAVARLEPAETAGRPEGARSAAPLYRLIPEGLHVEGAKVGAPVAMELFYVSSSWWRFAKKTVFWGTVLAGALLLLAGKGRALRLLILWGLFLGTLGPLLVGWRSPLLVVPFCEGLVISALLGGAFWAAGKLAAAFRQRRGRVPAGVKSAAILLAAALGLGGLSAEGARAGEPAPPPPAGVPFDGVLIPYDPAGLPGAPGNVFPQGGRPKVFIPSARFHELWAIAHPEEKTGAEPVPCDLVIANAEYSLRLEGDSCRVASAFDVNVLSERWVSLPLPFEAAQIAMIRLDGEEIGVAQLVAAPPAAGGAAGIPAIALSGRGLRRLEIDLAIPVQRDPGEFRVLAALLVSPAATLRAELPGGARVEARAGAGGPVPPVPLPVLARAEPGKTVAVVDLGGSPRLSLSWSFPKIEGQTGSQAESLSYSSLALTPEGYRIDRRERLRVTGRPVDAVEYRIAGGLRVTDLSGPEVLEWGVAREEGTPPREKLQVYFRRPVDSAEIRIQGRALLDAAAPYATLTLLGAVRQESFIGLHHGGPRRFRPDALGGLRRAAREDLLAEFPLPEAEAPDRLYHAFGSGEGETITAEPLSTETTVSTELVAVVEPDRLVVSARSRITVNGPGPLRHQVTIPAGWSVRTVRCEGLRDWEVVPGPAANRLVLTFDARLPTGAEVAWTAESDFAAPPGSIVLPPLAALPEAGETLKESARWTLAANDQMEIAVADAGRWVPAPLEAAPGRVRLPASDSYRFALRTPRAEDRGAEAPLRLTVTPRPSQLSATVVSFARLQEDSLQVNARVIFRMRLAGRDRFRFALPPGAELVDLETVNLRSRDVREAPGGTEVDIALQSREAGDHPVDITYRVRRAAGSPPVVRPLLVFDGDVRLQDVDQYVGVVQGSGNLVSGSAPVALERVEAESFPYLPEGVSAGSLRPTYRAARPGADWSLSLAEEPVVVSVGLAALASLGELTTVVGDDGTARTRAVYTVRNRSLQFLLVDLPPDSDLYGVTLNGKSAAVGRDSSAGLAGPRAIRIPVERVGAASLDLEVAIQYGERRIGLPALRGRANLIAPNLRETRVMETLWTIRFPDRYTVTLSGGNLKEVPASATHAKKVRNLLDQLQKVSRTAGEADSAKMRERAYGEIARLEQALGDNLTELEETNRSAREESQAGRLTHEALEEQWAGNDSLIRESKAAQGRLREALKDRGKGKDEAPPSKKEQAFLDATNYLKRSWRGGKEAKAPEAAREEGLPAGGAGLEDLLGEAPFGGLGGAAGARAPGEVEVAEPAPVDASKGLKPLAEPAGAGEAMGFEESPEGKGSISYTFLRSGGGLGEASEISLTFTRRDAVARLAALILLLAIPGFLLWARRGRRRRRAR